MRWPEEVKAFIRENVKGHSQDELAEMVNDRFDMDVTPMQIRYFKHNNGLTSGTKGGYHKSIFPEGTEQYVRMIAKGHSRKQIAELTNLHFGEEIFDEKRMAAYMKNHHITNGRDTTFKKGQESPTKGKTWDEFMPPESQANSRKTTFKKGNVPDNLLPIGSVVKNTEGYLLRKKSMDGTQWERWEFLHRAVWEENFGPVPKGLMVTFKNGNKEDCSIENLMLIDNQVNGSMNRRGYRSEVPEITEAAATLAKLRITVKAKRRAK